MGTGNNELAMTAKEIARRSRWNDAEEILMADFIPAEWLKGDKKRALSRIAMCIQLAEMRGVSPIIFVQNVDFIQGRFCWKSTFLLQLLRRAGWKNISYEWDGDPNSAEFWSDDAHGCTFLADNPETGVTERGTKITIGMVKKEGWASRNGSKWQSMPEQMFKYRACAFFCRTNAPEIMGGFYDAEEVRDIAAQERSAQKPIQNPPESANGGVVSESHYLLPQGNYSEYERAARALHEGKITQEEFDRKVNALMDDACPKEGER